MVLSRSLKIVLLIGLLVPTTLLILGIYHGLMQVIYRSGTIHSNKVLYLSYFQGLTLHGVINAIVLTTFFAVAFGHACFAFFLKKEPGKKASWLSLSLMVIGTLMAAWAMLAGKANVLYTFYPPLRAHPMFYLGAALIVVGSWVAYFDWIVIYRRWQKEYPGEKTPIAIVGTIVNFTVWFVCTLPVAYEILVLLVPWSMGYNATINIPLARMLFWFFGHALVYFWLLPAYIMFYTMLPKLSGGKLYSENAARLSFLLFLFLSIPIGVHHQFSEPALGRSVKFFQSILTFGIAIPSFITAFTIAASLEYGAWTRGARGAFQWMAKLPYFDKNNAMFGYLICGLILFIFGGITGIVNASYTLNSMVHNTSWLPGHFHMTVAGPVYLGIIGMSLYIVSNITGKEIRAKSLYMLTPYVWMIGLLLFSFGLMWGGLLGEPRRTDLGMTYLNPKHPLFRPEWVITTRLTLIGGIIMTLSFIMYAISFISTIASKKVKDRALSFPVLEYIHEEKPIPVLHTFKPWLAIMILTILLSYIPALINVFKYTGSGAPPYMPDNPTPMQFLENTK